ncbi:MAG: hypothetical protein NWE94_07350 [Candidatus Bathyarchaeota archaeon]|nr:hypothetical protein [Candidatus Bathyarchaeota archaeon]
MTALNKKAFKLPRVEKDTFIMLLRLGLEYNRERGVFSISSYNNIEKLVDLLSGILNVDRVTFLQSCIICGGDFPCQDCKYYEHCPTRDLPFHCVCPRCLKEGKNSQKSPKAAGQGTLDLFG